MTTANASNLDFLFQDLSEEDAVSISGGESIIAYGNASAHFLNNTGGIAVTNVVTNAVDQGTHEASSQSSSLSVAFNDTNNAPRVGGPGNAINGDNFVNGLLGV